MKVGDRLYCHTDLVMEDTHEIAATRGKLYEIVELAYFGLELINNQNKSHGFTFGEHGQSYYKNWFCDLKTSRKLKLEKIYKSQI